jgi:hypothetical protein
LRFGYVGAVDLCTLHFPPLVHGKQVRCELEMEEEGEEQDRCDPAAGRGVESDGFAERRESVCM